MRHHPIWLLLVGFVVLSACGDDRQRAGTDAGRDAVSVQCGNGILEGAEACDDGVDNSDTIPDACRTSCELAGCGDGVADQGESCDDGPANSDTVPDACRKDCSSPECGDGVVDM